MLGITKKSKPASDAGKKKLPVAEPIDPKVADRIHVMPARFYAAPAKRRSALTVGLVVVGVLLIGGLGAIAYVLLRPPASPLPVTNQPLNASQPAGNQNANTNTNQAAGDQNANVNLNTNAASPAEPTTTPTTTSANVNANTSVTPPVVLPRGQDADNDGLTAAEEALYGTDPAKQDTDGDSYADGSELLNGYDPAQPGITLANSGRLRSYQQRRYTVSYPAAWQAQELSSDGSEVVFRAPSGEFFEIIIIANPQRLSLEQWYDESFGTAADSVVPVTVGNFSGLRSADGRSYYFSDPTDAAVIYLVTYNVGTLNQVDFLLTFTVTLKSFALTP